MLPIQNNYFEDLPKELKLYIQSFIDEKSTAGRCCQVSSEWDKLFSRNALWKQIFPNIKEKYKRKGVKKFIATLISQLPTDYIKAIKGRNYQLYDSDPGTKLMWTKSSKSIVIHPDPLNSKEAAISFHNVGKINISCSYFNFPKDYNLNHNINFYANRRMSFTSNEVNAIALSWFKKCVEKHDRDQVLSGSELAEAISKMVQEGILKKEQINRKLIDLKTKGHISST